MITIQNEKIRLQVAEHGAELSSIQAGGREYLWQADPKFWNRHSPVLFPQVGMVWNKEYRHRGQVYPMGQHGFARDMDFVLHSEERGEAFFLLESSAETLTRYPFPFRLEIGYRLHDNSIDVLWIVKNTGAEEMLYQIGAHPAFLYRDLDVSLKERGFLYLYRDGKAAEELTYISPTEKGCTDCVAHTLSLPGGEMEITTDTFACDTYIFEGHQLSKITLADRHRRPYLSIAFNTPLVAVWSPSATKPDVPFICLEPWYGRCDRVGYEGELCSRDHMQYLQPGAIFSTSYTITLEDLPK